MKLPVGQIAILKDFNKKNFESTEHFDGRGLNSLIYKNLIDYRRNCGHNHVCSCRGNYWHITESGKEALKAVA